MIKASFKVNKSHLYYAIHKGYKACYILTLKSKVLSCKFIFCNYIHLKESPFIKLHETSF